MRIAVISDIHGNLRALDAVIADIRRRGADGTVNLGDCVAGPTWPRETCERLADLRFPTVRGNHDRWIVDQTPQRLSPAARFAWGELTQAQRTSLFTLPPTIDLGAGILAVHGTPSDDSTFLTEEVHDNRLIPAGRNLVLERLGDARTRQIVLCGHSHRQSLTQIPNGPLILNPGSVGCPIFADQPSAPMAEPRSPHARYAIITRANGRCSVELFAVDYDWEAAAAQARANGFPMWAETLLTGSVA